MDVSRGRKLRTARAAASREDETTTTVLLRKKRARRASDDGIAESEHALHLTPLIHAPASPENSLRLHTANQLEALHLTVSWFRLLPSRLGQNATVDLAIMLFVQSNEIWAKGRGHALSNGPLTPLYQNYWHLYGRTVENLRRLIAEPDGALSDEALLSCALLTHSERGVGLQSPSKDVPLRNTLWHLHGIQAILTARPATTAPSEISFSILSGQQILLHEVPVALGIPSPFENTDWFHTQSSESPTPLQQMTRLRLIGQRLLFDLPRLQMYVSRTNTSIRSSFRAAGSLANHLLACKDEEAENTLLHRVNVHNTTKPENAICVPYSYTFRSTSDFEAAMYYWQSRLMVLRLCWTISQLDSTFKQDDLMKEGVRTTKNLLMSWQYGEEQSLFGYIRFIFAGKVIWGAVIDFKKAFPNFVELRRSLARRIIEMMSGVYDEISEEMLEDITRELDGNEQSGPGKFDNREHNG